MNNFRLLLRNTFIRLTYPGTGIYGRKKFRVARYLDYGDILTLDAGCGNALFSLYCCRKMKNRVVAVSNNQGEVEENLKKLKHSNIPSHKITFSTHDLKSFKESFRDSFDQIVCFDVLEHILDDIAVLNNLNGYLKQGGTLLISVPYSKDTSLVEGAREGDHVRAGYSAAELCARVEKCGFHVLFTEKTGGRYTNRVREIKWGIGLKSNIFSFFGQAAETRAQLYYNHLCFFLLYPFTFLDNLIESDTGTTLLLKAAKL